METMDDFKDELEASFRQIKEGDIITGTVIAVSEEEITLDLKYYAQGISEEGPDHDKRFSVEARIGERVIGTGIGHTKKAAEQEAAYQALLLLKPVQKK